MDFLDPKKERLSRIRLLLGYCLIALAIAMSTLVLLYQSNGYGVNRDGKVTLSGLIFVSSQPSGASISLNGQPYKNNTNTRVVVPADVYNLQITKAGYRTWQRQVVVNGNDVQHFDYPFLFPTTLQTSRLAEFPTDPSFSTQSPDKRWLLLGRSDAAGAFRLYDFKNPKAPQATDITLPDGSFTLGDSTGAQTWTAVEWAADNTHVLLKHTFVTKGVPGQEYIVLDRDSPEDSVNLTNTLSLPSTDTVGLYDNRIEQFYVYDPATETLSLINASDKTVTSKLEHIIAYKPYADNMILYVSDEAPTGKTTTSTVSVVLQVDQKTTTLRELPAGALSYQLNLAQYAGNWYVTVGASNDSAAFIYKNPQNQVPPRGQEYPNAWRRLPVSSPSYLAFSSNTQYVLAENGQEFIVYDLENMQQYHYHAAEPIDQPQQHASWMDGNRLTYVSGGKVQVFDYDYRNRQSLMAANANYAPVFAPDYSYLYTLTGASADTKPALTSTPLTVTQQ